MGWDLNGVGMWGRTRKRPTVHCHHFQWLMLSQTEADEISTTIEIIGYQSYSQYIIADCAAKSRLRGKCRTGSWGVGRRRC